MLKARIFSIFKHKSRFIAYRITIHIKARPLGFPDGDMPTASQPSIAPPRSTVRIVSVIAHFNDHTYAKPMSPPTAETLT